MDKIELTEEQVAKAIEEIVEAELEKSMPMESVANGKVETPNTESLTTEEAVKEQKDDSKKKKKKKESMKKSDEEEKEEEAEEKSEEESKEEESEDKVEKSEEEVETKEEEGNEVITKSLEELAQHVDAEELELIRLWREEKVKETESMNKALTDTTDVAALVKAEISTQIEPLQKALAEKDETINKLNEKVEKMASEPAYDSRSVADLETIEKAEEEEQTPSPISKDQVLDTMTQMQLDGKGISSIHIAQFEATNTLPPNIQSKVEQEIAKQ